MGTSLDLAEVRCSRLRAVRQIDDTQGRGQRWSARSDHSLSTTSPCRGVRVRRGVNRNVRK